MKKLYFLEIACSLLALPAAAQQLVLASDANASSISSLRPARPVKADSVYATPEERPQFVGGNEALRAYIAKHITYPDQAYRQHISGKVLVRFVLNTQGAITAVQVVSGPGHGLDDEALRLMWHMPAWKPGREQGQPVQSVCTLPITFQQ